MVEREKVCPNRTGFFCISPAAAAYAVKKATGGYPYGKDPGRIPGRIDAALSHCAGICTGNWHHLPTQRLWQSRSQPPNRRCSSRKRNPKRRRSRPDAVPESEETAPPAETVPPPQLEIDETSPEQPAIGWLQIITRSAGNARAISGVSVLVTNGTEQQLHLRHGPPSPTRAAKPEKFRCRCRRLLSH